MCIRDRLRFLSLRHFRMVDGRSAKLRIIRNDQIVEPSRIVRQAPRHMLSARAGGDLLCASLCSPAIQSEGVTSASRERHDTQSLDIAVNSEAGGLTLELNSSAGSSGPARVTSPLGQVATARWDLTTSRHNAESDAPVFRLSEIKQDWRPPGIAPAKHAVRLARAVRRRNESWSYEHSTSTEFPVSKWSN